MIKVRVLALLTALALLLALPAVGYAQSQPPHVVKGMVMVDGLNAPAGTMVTAMMGDAMAGEAMVMSGGSYVMQVMGAPGSEVSFMIGQRMAMENLMVEFGGASELDLTAMAGMMEGGAGEMGVMLSLIHI